MQELGISNLAQQAREVPMLNPRLLEIEEKINKLSNQTITTR